MKSFLRRLYCLITGRPYYQTVELDYEVTYSPERVTTLMFWCTDCGDLAGQGRCSCFIRRDK